MNRLNLLCYVQVSPHFCMFPDPRSLNHYKYCPFEIKSTQAGSQIYVRQAYKVHVLKDLCSRYIVEVDRALMPGADPGEVKRVNFHPPFSEHPSFFFVSYPSNIDWF